MNESQSQFQIKPPGEKVMESREDKTARVIEDAASDMGNIVTTEDSVIRTYYAGFNLSEFGGKIARAVREQALEELIAHFKKMRKAHEEDFNRYPLGKTNQENKSMADKLWAAECLTRAYAESFAIRSLPSPSKEKGEGHRHPDMQTALPCATGAVARLNQRGRTMSERSANDRLFLEGAAIVREWLGRTLRTNYDFDLLSELIADALQAKEGAPMPKTDSIEDAR